MRFKGTLAKWNADRGFGFIRPMEPGPDVFVHVSAWPRGTPPPQVGDVLTYEVTTGPDGRTRAVAVARPGEAVRPATPASGSRLRPPRSRRDAPAGRFATAAVVLIGIASVAGYQRFSAGRSEPATVGDVIEQLDEAPAPYACDGRTRCSEMNSCDEARWVLRHCPNTEMDGDGDGVPCEQQWCAN